MKFGYTNTIEQILHATILCIKMLKLTPKAVPTIFIRKKKKHCQLQMYAYLIFGIEKFNLYMTFVFQIKRD